MLVALIYEVGARESKLQSDNQRPSPGAARLELQPAVVPAPGGLDPRRRRRVGLLRGVLPAHLHVVASLAAAHRLYTSFTDSTKHKQVPLFIKRYFLRPSVR